MSLRNLTKHCAIFLLLCGSAFAFPKLRLSQTAIGPVSIAPNTMGPGQVVDAYNAGDGTISPQVTSLAPQWLSATISGPQACEFGNKACYRIAIGLQTAALPAGAYTGVIRVTDPNALDAPQTITVTVQIGGGIPAQYEFFAAPGMPPAEASFYTNSPVTTTFSSHSGGNWLQVGLDSGGSQSVFPYKVVASAQPGLAEGTYTGTLTVTGSLFAPDNKNVPVTLHVTSQPIVSLSEESLQWRLGQGAPRQSRNIILTNRGIQALTVTGVTSATMAGGNWLTAQKIDDAYIVQVTVDPAGLSRGEHRGSVTITSNAANGTLTIPVTLAIVQPELPSAYFGGVSTNLATEPGVAPGTIASIYGVHFSYDEPTGASSTPLPTVLGSIRVLVNDRPAPLFYTSYGQINFQVPYETAPGEARVTVERGGIAGNTVTVNVALRAPRILTSTGRYGLIVNPDGTLAQPQSPWFTGARPARRGEALVIYALGLGPTAPSIESGHAAPEDPSRLARVSAETRVVLGTEPNQVTEPAFYSGLTPHYVGLYQVNFVVPENAPRGDQVELFLRLGLDVSSNRVTLAIE